MTVAEKVNEVINSYVKEKGTDPITIMSGKEICSMIIEKYDELKPKINQDGKLQPRFLLTDFCYNSYNEGLTRTGMEKFAERDKLLKRFFDGTYGILGLNYPYNGKVYHTPEGKVENRYVVGEWINGKFNSFPEEKRTFFKELKEFEQKAKEKAEKIDNELNNLSLEGKIKERIVKIRVNQNEFRQLLLKRYHHCCLCSVTDPKLLVASHIKPWAEAEATEKLDINNGLLLCPNHDKLFDKGYITFDDNGKIIISERLEENNKIYMNVREGMKIAVYEENKPYLEYHRKNIFDKF